ncbi:MAG: alpha/beta hydrolase, partial [Vicinamibacterales bacterium]
LIPTGTLIVALVTGWGWSLPAHVLAQQPAPTPSAAPAAVVQHAKYSIFVQGVPMGTEDVSVERVPEGWVVLGSGTIGAPVSLSLRQARVQYGTMLEPRGLSVEGWLRDQKIDLTMSVKGSDAVSSYIDNGETKQSTTSISADAIVLSGNFFGAYAILGARLASASVGQRFPFFIPPFPEKTVVLREIFNERVQVAARSFPIRRHVLVFEDPKDPVEIEVETEPDGKFVRLVVPATQLQIAREDVVSVSARQQRFLREGDEDVRMPANGFSLAGTLSRPRVLPPPAPGRKVARLPAVVLVPGAAPSDRDDITLGVPLNGQLAAGLADAGHLVLRYDKRGVGQSGGREEAAGLADFADDVVQVVRWLEKRPDVDPKNITLIGRAEGAWIAMLAAAREKRVAKLVLVGAAAAKGAELVLEQQQSALNKATLSDAEKRNRVALQMQIHEAVLSGGTWEGVPQALRNQADSPWFASFLSFDPAQWIAKLRQPLLIVHAENDTQVPSTHATRLMDIAKGRKKDPGESLFVVPGVNQFLVPAPPGENVDDFRGRSVSPAAVTAIADFIARK